MSRRARSGRSGRRLALLTTALCPSLSACLEITREIWVYEDGSARVSLEIAVSEIIVAVAQSQEGEDPLARFQEVIRRAENMEGVSAHHYSANGLHHFAVETQLDDVSELAITSADLDSRIQRVYPNPVQTELRVERQEDRSILYVETQSVPGGGLRRSLLEQAASDTLAKVGEPAIESMLADRYYTVILHAPRIIYANGEIDEERRVARWRVPLAELFLADSVFPGTPSEVPAPDRPGVVGAGAPRAGCRRARRTPRTDSPGLIRQGPRALRASRRSRSAAPPAGPRPRAACCG